MWKNTTCQRSDLFDYKHQGICRTKVYPGCMVMNYQCCASHDEKLFSIACVSLKTLYSVFWKHSNLSFRESPCSRGVRNDGYNYYTNVCCLREVKVKGKGSFYIAQSVGPLKVLYTFLPYLADLFIPTPTRLLREAF